MYCVDHLVDWIIGSAIDIFSKIDPNSSTPTIASTGFFLHPLDTRKHNGLSIKSIRNSLAHWNKLIFGMHVRLYPSLLIYRKPFRILLFCRFVLLFEGAVYLFHFIFFFVHCSLVGIKITDLTGSQSIVAAYYYCWYSIFVLLLFQFHVTEWTLPIRALLSI